MRKSKLTTLTVLILIVTMISLIMVSGTYAKYTKELTGSDTAVVAKFSVGGLDSSTFDLFATAVTEVDGETAESEVASGTIAPGTGGKFTVTLTNDSEVSVSYKLKLAETNTSGIPIEYSIDDKASYVTYDQLASEANATGTLDYGSTQTEITIYWRWAFTGAESTNYTQTQNDTTDTTLGETAATGTAPEITVTATATFEQID